MNAPLSPSAALPPAVAARAEPGEIADTSTASGVSWAAILAGAAAAAALSMILLMLGTGLGLASASAWPGQGASATTLGVSTIAWLTFTQLAASGIGGYLAGRLRTKWVSVHTDEVYFRDTAHGFLAWAVATLATAAVLTSATGSIVGTGAQAGAAVAGTAATTTGAALAAATNPGAPSSAQAGVPSPGLPAGANVAMSYVVDTLFRKDASASAGGAQADNGGASNLEVTRILANGLRTSTLPPDDIRYVGQVVAQRTGLSQADAEKRVSDTFAKIQNDLRDAESAARDAADKARKASAGAALWLFVSMLIGAFVASLAATFGGRRRDL